MSLIGKFFRGSAFNVVDHVVRLAVMLFVTPLIMHSLGMESYGVWLLMMTIISYYDYLDFGTSLAGVRFLGKAIGKDDDLIYRKSVASLHRIYVRTAGICLVLGLAVAAGYWQWGPKNQWHEQISLLLLVFGGTFSVRFFLRTHLIVLKSHVRYDFIVVASMVKLVVQTTLVVTLLHKGYGIIALVIAHVAADLSDQLLIVLFSRHTDRRSPEREHYDPAIAREILRQSATLFLGLAGGNLRNRVDPLIVGGFCGLTLVPIYNIGVRIIQQFTDLANAVLGGNLLAAFSQIAGKSGDDSVRQRFLQSITWSVPVALFAMTLAFLYGPAFIIRWLGPEFRESGPVLRLLAFPFALELLFFPTAPLFIAIGKYHYLGLARFGAAIFNLLLSILLAIYFGLLGVVVATCIEMLLLFGIVFPLLIRRVAETRMGKMFQVEIPKAILLIAAPMGAFHFATREFAQPDYLNLAVLSALQTALAGVLMLAFYFNADQRVQLMQSVRRMVSRQAR